MNKTHPMYRRIYIINGVDDTREYLRVSYPLALSAAGKYMFGGERPKISAAKMVSNRIKALTIYDTLPTIDMVL